MWFGKIMDTMSIGLHLKKIYFCKIIAKHLKKKRGQILG
jgi:hypothetical protein